LPLAERLVPSVLTTLSSRTFVNNNSVDLLDSTTAMTAFLAAPSAELEPFLLMPNRPVLQSLEQRLLPSVITLSEAES